MAWIQETKLKSGLLSYAVRSKKLPDRMLGTVPKAKAEAEFLLMKAEEIMGE